MIKVQQVLHQTASCVKRGVEIKTMGEMKETIDHLVDRAWADCHHCGLQYFALGLLRQHDASLGYRLRCETLHQNPVKQGEELPEGL